MSAATNTQHRRALLPESTAIRTLELPELLPADSRLALSEELGLVALVSRDEAGRPVLLAVQLFTPSEWSLLMALFGQHPNYCPYEVLLAYFTCTVVTERQIERWREQLYEAKEEGTWDQLMRPARNLLSRVRFKLRSFGITVVSLLEMGYTLLPLQEQKGTVTHASDTRE